MHCIRRVNPVMTRGSDGRDDQKVNRAIPRTQMRIRFRRDGDQRAEPA